MRWVFCLLILCSFQKRIVLTFDDAPMPASSLHGKRERIEKYIEQLDALQIHAAFFCIGEHVATPEGEECVRRLSEAGHTLGNHSYHHLSLSDLSLQDFERELLETEKLLISHPTYEKWFRYPNLDWGDRNGDHRKRVAALLLLKEKGYRHAYSSINTLDWYLNLKDVSREVYLACMDEWIEEGFSRWHKLSCQNVVHILLMHQNDINLKFLPDLVTYLRERGWEIVEPKLAYAKPLPFPSNFSNSHCGPYRWIKSLNSAYIDQKLENLR